MHPSDAPWSAPSLAGLPGEPSRDRHAGACTHAQSLDLLRQMAIGRVIHTQEAMPAVTPTCFALDSDDGVVIPLPVGSMLAASIEEAVVGFQADLLDERTLQGWTVLVIGRSHRVRDPARLADLQRHGPRPWGHRAADAYLRIDPELVMGTRLGF